MNKEYETDWNKIIPVFLFAAPVFFLIGIFSGAGVLYSLLFSFGVIGVFVIVAAVGIHVVKKKERD